LRRRPQPRGGGGNDNGDTATLKLIINDPQERDIDPKPADFTVKETVSRAR
jgi:hypothetical protein